MNPSTFLFYSLLLNKEDWILMIPFIYELHILSSTTRSESFFYQWLQTSFGIEIAFCYLVESYRVEYFKRARILKFHSFSTLGVRYNYDNLPPSVTIANYYDHLYYLGYSEFRIILLL